MAKLTIKELEALSPADIGRVVRDGDGLSGRVRANAQANGGVSVTFTYRYRWDGKVRDEPCGSWPKERITAIREARDQVRRLIDGGVDPIARRTVAQLKVQAEEAEHRRRIVEEVAIEAERRAELERLNRRMTVRALFERWAELELSTRKDGGAETKRGVEKDVMPVLGERKADEITRADVMAVLDIVKARGANRLANRLLAELRQMFGFAAVREIVKVDPTSGIRKKDVGGKDEERERVLSEAEIRVLPAKIGAANLLRSTEHALWIMLATCCRIGELTNARLADVDLHAGIWTLPDSKNGKPHRIYLSDYAVRHFRHLVALSRSPTWLLPSARNDGPVYSKSITKQVYDRQRGKPKTNGTALTDSLCLLGGAWVPHDLRRTGATLMGELGVDGDVIEKCLNHTEENRVKRVYQRAVRKEEQAEAWRLLGERLDLLTRHDLSNVAMLHTKSA
ncbi:tyrosine-type recombinase/integrase [Caballeronia glebae]|uniref:tyrosine-type recombinase/integrase n=1 Tax=Caballeronia glebae TaxID=1777143 RepID=UPI0038B8C9B6